MVCRTPSRPNTETDHVLGAGWFKIQEAGLSACMLFSFQCFTSTELTCVLNSGKMGCRRFSDCNLTLFLVAWFADSLRLLPKENRRSPFHLALRQDNTFSERS